MDTIQATDAAQKTVGVAQKASEGLPPLSPEYVAGLSILATVGLVLMWAVFWFATVKTKESVHEILMSPSFFRTVTVMGVIAATVVLSLAGRLEGNITGAILSGIVGYVLGSSLRPREVTQARRESPVSILSSRLTVPGRTRRPTLRSSGTAQKRAAP